MHTWDQQLKDHFHLHCIIPAGAVDEDWTCWIPCKNQYLFNQQALAKVFRGKFIDYMTQAYEGGELFFSGIITPFEKPEQFKKLKNTLYSKKWVVHVKEPIENTNYMFEYLGRYTHRVAISNHRIISLKEGKVSFQYKNPETNRMEVTSIEAVEFIRRFLLHVLPKRFIKIRNYSFLTNRDKKSRIKKILLMHGKAEPVMAKEESVEELMFRLAGQDITLCPCCKKGKIKIILKISEGTGWSSARMIRPAVWRETG